MVLAQLGVPQLGGGRGVPRKGRGAARGGSIACPWHEKRVPEGGGSTVQWSVFSSCPRRLSCLFSCSVEQFGSCPYYPGRANSCCSPALSLYVPSPPSN